MERPFACAFCGVALDLGTADKLMGVLDCAACGRLAQLDAAAVAALARQTPLTATLLLKAPECSACGKPLARAMVTAEYGIARCECGVINDLASIYRSARAALKRREPEDKAARATRLPTLSHFLVRELPGALDISWMDRNPLRFGLVPAFAVMPYALAATQWGWVAVAAPLLGVGGASIAAFVYGLVQSRGRLHITVTKTELKVHRSPLPWPTRTIRRDQLLQLFVRESGIRDADGGYADREWWLAAMLKGKKQLALTPPFEDPSMPRFLEQRLERYLGIKDRPVEGEAPKD